MLLDLDRSNTAWRDAVTQLATATQLSEPYTGQVPASLIPPEIGGNEWFAADETGALELQQVETGKFVIGYRGAMSASARTRLLELAPGDTGWQTVVDELQKRAASEKAGQFLGRFVQTAAQVFPNIYIFSTTAYRVSAQRDTFVIVCSLAPLDLENLETTGYWSGKPFAAQEAAPDGGPGVIYTGQMDAVLALAHGLTLTDDFAPVENLLLPIFADQ